MAWDDQNRNRGRSDDYAELEVMFQDLKNRIPKLGAGIWVLGAILLLLWLSTGIYTVAPDERGVVMRFGKMVRVTDPGPHLRLPWPIESVLKPQVTEVQRIEVGFWTVTAGPPAEYETVEQEARMLTGDENIVSLEFIVQFRVKREQGKYAVKDYLFNIRPIRTRKGQNKVVKQVAEAAMREVVGRHIIDEVLTEGKELVQRETAELMQSILDKYGAGIEITAVQLQDVQPPTREVQLAFKDVASAREDKVRLETESQSYANDLLPKARGEAEAIKAAAEGYSKSQVIEAKGRASRFLSLMEAYQMSRKVTRERLYLDAMQEVLEGAKKIIIETKTAGQILPYLPLETLAGKTPK